MSIAPGTFSTILFDLDGTLTDPKMGITKSVRYALTKMGRGSVDTESLVPFIGPPLKESFMKYSGFSDGDADRAIAFYREYFSSKGIFENSLYPGMDALLRELSAKNVALMVATSKPTVFAERICAHFAIKDYFNAIEGSELDGRNSNKAELIGAIAAKHGIDAGRTLMVGDREHDVIGAARNGIAAVGVGYGYGSEEELMNAGAAHYARTVGDLRDLLLGVTV